jgi:hypothetical protein
MSDLRDTGAYHPPPVGLESAANVDDAPTESHLLASSDHEDIGHAQADHPFEKANDLGWNEAEGDIANPLIGGLSNQQLWQLIRRFNMVRFYQS